MSHSPRQDPKKGRRAQLIAGGMIAVAVVAMLALYLWTEVCDEQVNSAGRVVTVCRHVQATDAPILALGVIVLVGLGTFFTEISIFGLTVKRQLDEVREKQSEADEEIRRTARKVEKTAEKVDETAVDAADFHARILARDEVSLASSSVRQVGTPNPDVDDLAQRYNQLRWTMPSGSARTTQMTQVVREMQDILRDTSTFDISAHLNHSDRGMRLAAYVYLNEHKAPGHFQSLMEAVAGEDKPFGQYWGLQAVKHQLTSGAAQLNTEARRKLGELRDRVGQSTDRARVLRGILE